MADDKTANQHVVTGLDQRARRNVVEPTRGSVESENAVESSWAAESGIIGTAGDIDLVSDHRSPDSMTRGYHSRQAPPGIRRRIVGFDFVVHHAGRFSAEDKHLVVKNADAQAGAGRWQ